MAPHSQHAPMQASDWGSLEETSRSPGHVAEWVPGLLDWMAINGAEGVSGKSALVKVIHSRARRQSLPAVSRKLLSFFHQSNQRFNPPSILPHCHGARCLGPVSH